MTRHISAVVFFLGFLVILTGCSEQAETEHGVGESSVGPEMLNENLRAGENIKLLDVSSVQKFEKKHIDGAINIPLNEVSAKQVALFNLTKNDAIVVYAQSSTPANNARMLLSAMGYQSVNMLSGGLVHWEEDGFPTATGKSKGPVFEEAPEEESSLRVEPADYDFGKILAKDGIVTTTFILVNEGEQEISVQQVSTSCGCTSAEVPEEQILPGEQMAFTVSFDPDFHKEPAGELTRTVFLQTSEGIEIQTKIHVEIIEES